jgi:hypothetical protein
MGALSRGDPRLLVLCLVPFLLLPLISFALSRMSGWAVLAQRYPGSGEPPQPRLRLGYGVFRGWCGYNGCLIVSADQRGLFLSVWPILAIGHASIHIPWTEVREIRRASLWGRSIYRLITAQAPDVDFALLGRAWEFVRPQAEAARVAIS